MFALLFFSCRKLTRMEETNFIEAVKSRKHKKKTGKQLRQQAPLTADRFQDFPGMNKIRALVRRWLRTDTPFRDA